MKLNILIAAVAGLALVSGCENQTGSNPTARTYEQNIIDQQLQTVTATVESINPQTREVTLRGADDRLVMFRATEAVRNFGQVKVGDRVKVNFYEATAGRLLRPGETAPDIQEKVDTMRAPEGEKPGMAVRRELTKSAKITAIDPDSPSVTLQDAAGVSTTIRVRDKSRLGEIKVGDEVVMTYVEGVAVSVVPAN